MKQKGILIVVSGFAGTGKSTVVKMLAEKYSEQYALSISMTTREPRKYETHGVEYFFSTKEEFERTIAEDGFIEHACYIGNYYGTPRKYVEEQLEAGKDVLLEIEIQGALQVKEKLPDTMLVFVMPPSAEILFNRLKGRGTETDDVIRKRMLRAVEESQGIEQYDYILVNDDLDVCVEGLHQMIQSEKLRASRNIPFIENMRKELVDLKKGEV
ncbi:MAG: guanylate kinase [Lachnospiraceae bacterium]|nr:guanylate kinase [Lachnospiraceae bacterium]